MTVPNVKKRQPKDYNWDKMEFDTGLLLPRNFTRPRQRKIQFFVVHHMIILNRNMQDNDANKACYRTWINEGREASANYGVDGDYIDQFVWDNDASWANADWEANHSSITVEHANATLDEPGSNNDYVIDERTFFNGARLIAQGHNNFGIIPKRNVTVKKHSNFHSTACPGPYMDRNWNRYFDLMHDIYNEIKAGRKVADAPDAPVHSALQPAKLSVDSVVTEVINGVWGNDPERHTRLKEAGYDPNDIQNRVNLRLNAPHAKKTVEQVAREVINGVWGNNPTRYNRLMNAGYNPTVVQDLVNKLLRG